jgi:hypothetical protein
MSDFNETLDALRRARGTRDDAREQLQRARMRQLTLQRLQNKAERREILEEGEDNEQPVFYPDQSEELKRERVQIQEQQGALRQRNAEVGRLIGDLFQRTPQQLIEEWDDSLPIMLLPLRVETRFKDAELWVRVFPDEIAINTHEKLLTEREQTFGMAYWKGLRAAKDDDARKSAWQDLVKRFGGNRAAWVALQTKPTNWSDPPPASDDVLQFPKFDVAKPDSWTEAPHSRVMPDRFVLMLFRGGKAVHTIVGNQVDDIVVVGPAPLDDEGKSTLKRDPATGRLVLGDEFSWIADFPLAVEKGLGFRVPLNEDEASGGFNQLLVIGLKVSLNETDTQQLIEQLIDNHHYSAKGFVLIKQGTPTNNTDNDSSGFGATDPQAEQSFFVETGPPLFAFDADVDKATDGQRLAEYLGLQYDALAHIDGADLTDHAESIAMNKALYAGMLGYYLNTLLNDVMSNDTLERVRALFTEYVTGRGPLPAVRIGNQPYGFVLTSAFPQWSYGAFAERVFRFEENVRRVLAELQSEWATLKSQLPHISKDTDANANLIKVLGLQPTSADYYQRVGYSYDYLRNEQQFAFGGRYGADVIGMFFERNLARAFLAMFGYDPTNKPVPLLLQLIWRHYQTRLDRENLIDGLPLSETQTIKPYEVATGRNYIDWLLENSDNTQTLEAEDFGEGVAPPHALLYLMLRYALLHEGTHSIFNLLETAGISAQELVRSRKFMNVSTQPDVSHWEVFRAPANRILPNESSTRSLLEFVQIDRFRSNVGRNIADAKDGLTILAKLPTARLERLLAEHIDTVNYRLDSWQTALFDLRVRAQRNLSGEQRKLGLHLGSYGYLENLRPARARHVKIPEDVLPQEMREGADNLFLDSQNGGYVHTPSLNHATGAAILRSGYLTHASRAEQDKLAVNLSSARVRRAKYLIDGVRSGQSLESLLGYLFERGLHDWTTRAVDPVILDHLKPVFRKAFPIKRTKVPQQGITGDAAKITEDFSVTNGLDLARTTTPFPYGIAELNSLDPTQSAAIQQEKSNLENSLDSLRDVLTAEAAYQLALGNFDRAGAVMRSISGGDMPVQVEVIDSSRGSDLSFTNRVALQFDPGVVTNPWAPIPLRRRARTEPAFNKWAGDLLGDPKTIRCSVQTNDAAVSDIVSLADLALQPLDLVFLIGKKVEATGFSELESRVRYFFAQKHSLGDDVVVKIEFANSGSPDLTVRSFAEVLPLANAIRELAGKSRPLQARDFVPTSKEVSAPADNPGNIDVVELQGRVTGIRAEFDTLLGDLQNAANAADVAALRQSLIAIANAGFVHAFPLTAFGSDQAHLDMLLAQNTSLQQRYADTTAEYDKNLARVNDAATKPPQKVGLLRDMAKPFLGDDFVVLPRFSFTNLSEIVAAFGDRDQLLKYIGTQGVPLPIDEWLHGVSLVRQTMHTFGLVRILSETFGAKFGDCHPIQLPYRSNDTWLGVEFPEGTTIVHDTIAMLQCLPQSFTPAGAQCGFLIEEWTETLPQKEEVTGITFNYDTPNSTAANAVLLAVTPVETGHWSWDNLVGTVLDTFERAKLRAVEPDMIDTLTRVAPLLPATIAEFTTGKSTINLDYARNLASVNAATLELSRK